jgi:hypothetical protein
MNGDAMNRRHPRFDAKPVRSGEWVIHDHAYEQNDARRVVAFVWEADPGEFEVTWVRRLPLPLWYDSVSAVLADVAAISSRRTTSIPISHMPPPRARLAGV